MVKNRFNALVNIGGLTLSLSACLFIFLYLQDELSFDQFHKDAKNIHRISLTLKFNDLDVFIPMASAPLGAAMTAQIPEVRESFRFYGLDATHTFRYGDKAFTEKRVLYADSNLFSFFSFHLREGNKKTALNEPNTVVITPALALKYFNRENALGQLLFIDGETFTVSGIVESPPSNSHIRFDALLSMRSTPFANSHSWMGNRFLTYIKLNPGSDLIEVGKKLDNLVLANIGPDLENSLGVSLEQFLEQKNKIGYNLHPLIETHLYSKFPRDITPASDITYVYLFAAVGLALLLISCFNFMNLSTAQFASHVRANSIRKTLGASRWQLITSFLSQTLILCAIAWLISAVVVYSAMPWLNSISGKSFAPSIVVNGSGIFAGLIMALFAAIISASYPSYYLTSFNPAESLRGKFNTTSRSEYIRKGLVVFQYTVSIGMIAFTLVLFDQLDFITHQHLGFAKENIIALKNIDRIGHNATPLKNALLTEQGVIAASFTDRTIFERMSGEALRVPNNPQSHIMNYYVADEDQLKVMGCKIIAGRFFSKDFPSDSNAVVINEAAMSDLGWQDVESKELAADGDIRYTVVGVINNFNYESLRNDIKPLLIFYNPQPGSTLTIRYAGDSRDLISMLDKNWKQFGNGEPFEYSFLDQDFNTFFQSESRIGKLLTLFSSGVILIACLGLFALSSFTAEKRTREIGIRKVVGASVNQVTALLSMQFARLIVIAFLLSVVPSFLISQKWLEGFAFHYRLTVAPFLIAGGSALIISLVTIAYHAIKAARTNPAKALCSE
jgi:putative ABC transport system permease protein